MMMLIVGVFVFAALAPVSAWTPTLSNRVSPTFALASGVKPVHFKRLTALSSFLNEDIDEVMNEEKGWRGGTWLWKRREKMISLQAQLASAGASGLIAYGVLNCLYYTLVTAVVWASMTVKAAASSAAAAATTVTFKQKLRVNAAKLPKVMLVVWAGSQATKAFRIAGSVALAPVAGTFIDRVRTRFGWTKGRTVTFISSMLLGGTFMFYAALILFSSVIA
jgi:hypothetical protein